jgi:two-component system, NtrC family, sensor kinase
MFYSTRAKLTASFTSVVCLVVLVSLFVGGRLLYRAVLNEATNRVRLNLNAAREIYTNRINSIACPLSVCSLEPVLRSAIKRRDLVEIVPRLETVANRANLDFIGVVTQEGRTLCRIATWWRDTGSERS